MPKVLTARERKARDKLIEQGLSQAEIARRLKLDSRAVVYEYLTYTGQLELWRKKRAITLKEAKKKKAKDKVEKLAFAGQVGNLSRLLIKYKIGQLPESERPANYATFICLSTYTRHRDSAPSYETLFTFYQRYFDAKHAQQKTPLSELRKGLEEIPYDSSAQRLIQRINEKPLNATDGRLREFRKKQITEIIAGGEYDVKKIARKMGTGLSYTYRLLSEAGINLKGYKSDKLSS